MELQLCSLKFKNAHFGIGTLDSSDKTFTASRIFSALFLEAMKLGVSEELLTLAQSKDFALSDAFPFLDKMMFLPKPIGFPKIEEMNEVDLKQARQEAKAAKKLEYIPLDRLKEYLSGTANLNELGNILENFAKYSYITKKGKDPFNVGVTSYSDRVYFLISKNDLINELLELLQYSGLGGKRSSGYGEFELRILKVPEEVENCLNVDDDSPKLLLTTSIPKVNELAKTLGNANYLLQKESGFAYSEIGEQFRKQDIYKFKVGSTFNSLFEGDIYDIRPDDYPHPVWNYARPLMLNIAERGEKLG